MAAPPVIAPAPQTNHHNSAQDPIHDQSLRDHQVISSYPPPPPTDYERAAMQAPSPSGSQDYQAANRNLDPAMGGASGIMNAGTESGGEETSADGRKGFGKRELSTSKRAAQNRAAQRAFRQRKEGYIKKLEEQVRDYAGLSESYKSLQAENYQLRDYVISLQSRLLESQGDYPQPPPNISLAHPSEQRPPQHELAQPLPRSTQMEYEALSQLRAAARQDSANATKHANDAMGYSPDSQLAKRLKGDGAEASEQAANTAQEALAGSGVPIEPRLSASPSSRDLSVGSVLNSQATRDRPPSRQLLQT